ncbi:MAG: transposase family protein, partial [Clostridia bacterium]|nr:transposase family protein [Clostridia bacterium]
MKNFIINLFNLEVNSISDLEIINESGMVFTLLTLRKTPTECPHCKHVTELVHDYRRRTINHSILNDMELTLVYNQRRMYCRECMKSFPEKNPFVSPGRRISNYTILHVMKLLKNPEVTFSMAAASTSLSIPTVERIFDDHAGIST